MTVCTSAGVRVGPTGTVVGAAAGPVAGAAAGGATGVVGAALGAVSGPVVGAACTTAAGAGAGTGVAGRAVAAMAAPETTKYSPIAWNPCSRLARALKQAMTMLMTPIAVSRPGRLTAPGVE